MAAIGAVHMTARQNTVAVIKNLSTRTPSIRTPSFRTPRIVFNLIIAPPDCFSGSEEQNNTSMGQSGAFSITSPRLGQEICLMFSTESDDKVDDD
jgi:hypothetical protein